MMMHLYTKSPSPETVPSSRVNNVAEHGQDGFAAGVMADLIFKLSVNQLCALIRQSGIKAEQNAMLTMLENLVIAGEIPFPDFMGRVQNLFPQVFDQIDSALLAKLSSYIND